MKINEFLLKVIFGIFLICFILIGAPVRSAESPKLLSDNRIGNGLGADIDRLSTGAQIRWISTGPFPTSDNFLKTRFTSDGRTARILDGNTYGDGNAQSFGNWSGGVYYSNFIIDLRVPYLITGATLFSVQNHNVGIESFRVLFGNDENNFTEAGKFQCPSDFVGSEKLISVPLKITFEKPAIARYVQFIVKKNPARFQAILGEAAVWGTMIPKGMDRKAFLPENRRLEVAFQTLMIGAGAVRFDWSRFSGQNVKGFRLYKSDRPFQDIKDSTVEKIGEYPAEIRQAVIAPVKPNVIVYYGITAVYEKGEYPFVKCQKVTACDPLRYERFADMLGINHYWGGGGSKTDLYADDAWELVTLDLLEQSPFRFIRWWINPERPVRELHRRGIEATAGSGSADSLSESLGIRIFSGPNEPHLSSTTPEQCVTISRKGRDRIKAINPANVIYGPSVGVNEASLSYLDKFYQAGGKSIFDALDLHTYVDTGKDFHQPRGYEPGSPEALLERVEKARAVMKKYGMDLPLIASEFGYSDAQTGNSHGHITPKNKAEKLVRALIIHNVLGFRRVMLYAFRDEGTDPCCAEHLFGLITRDGQKKPAFYAIQTLAHVLGNTLFQEPMKGTESARTAAIMKESVSAKEKAAIKGANPKEKDFVVKTDSIKGNALREGTAQRKESSPIRFGYIFRNIEKPGELVSVVWNGAGEEEVSFRTQARELEVIDLFGEVKKIEIDRSGIFRYKTGPSVVYFRGSAPIELLPEISIKK